MEIIESIMLAIVGIWLSTIEWRQRKMLEQVEKTLTREEIDLEIRLRQEAIKQIQTDFKEDLKRVESKIDHLISLELQKRK